MVSGLFWRVTVMIITVITIVADTELPVYPGMAFEYVCALLALLLYSDGRYSLTQLASL